MEKAKPSPDSASPKRLSDEELLEIIEKGGAERRELRTEMAQPNSRDSALLVGNWIASARDLPTWVPDEKLLAIVMRGEEERKKIKERVLDVSPSTFNS